MTHRVAGGSFVPRSTSATTFPGLRFSSSTRRGEVRGPAPLRGKTGRLLKRHAPGMVRAGASHWRSTASFCPVGAGAGGRRLPPARARPPKPSLRRAPCRSSGRPSPHPNTLRDKSVSFLCNSAGTRFPVGAPSPTSTTTTVTTRAEIRPHRADPRRCRPSRPHRNRSNALAGTSAADRLPEIARNSVKAPPTTLEFHRSREAALPVVEGWLVERR
jgi:hypothetical protein